MLVGRLVIPHHRELLLEVRRARPVPITRSVLPDQPAGTALTDLVLYASASPPHPADGPQEVSRATSPASRCPTPARQRSASGGRSPAQRLQPDRLVLPERRTSSAAGERLLGYPELLHTCGIVAPAPASSPHRRRATICSGQPSSAAIRNSHRSLLWMDSHKTGPEIGGRTSATFGNYPLWDVSGINNATLGSGCCCLLGAGTCGWVEVSSRPKRAPRPKYCGWNVGERPATASLWAGSTLLTRRPRRLAARGSAGCHGHSVQGQHRRRRHPRPVGPIRSHRHQRVDPQRARTAPWSREMARTPRLNSSTSTRLLPPVRDSVGYDVADPPHRATNWVVQGCGRRASWRSVTIRRGSTAETIGAEAHRSPLGRPGSPRLEGRMEDVLKTSVGGRRRGRPRRDNDLDLHEVVGQPPEGQGGLNAWGDLVGTSSGDAAALLHIAPEPVCRTHIPVGPHRHAGLGPDRQKPMSPRLKPRTPVGGGDESAGPPSVTR